MKETLTEVVLILDRSGSMAEHKSSIIGAYNGFLKGQKEFDSPGEVFFTTVLFNDAYRLLYDRVDISRAGPVTGKDYVPQGRGALKDAFGKIIDDLGFTLNATAEEEKPRKVVLIAVTNGEDNASSRYSTEKLTAMVNLQIQTYSWEFLYFGINTGPAAAALTGIAPDRAFGVTGDAAGISAAFRAAGTAVCNLRKYRSLYAGGAPDFREAVSSR